MTWLARRAVKAPLVTRGLLRHYVRRQTPPASGCSFLIYHRVDGGLPLELDLDPDLFRRQLECLAAATAVISYDEALARLEKATPAHAPAAGRSGGPDSSLGAAAAETLPPTVLTFDDGYVDFYTRVYPMLQRLRLPAILFVTTGFVEDGIPYPMMSNPDAALAPVTWDMLGEMQQSGLVTLGAHTHTHPVLATLPPAQVEEELARPLELFERRLGLRPKHFAYPRAQATPALRTLVARHYSSAVIGGGMRATPENFDRYRIPRIPIRRSDGWQFFRAKLRGWLDDEEPMYERLRALAGRSAQ